MKTACWLLVVMMVVVVDVYAGSGVLYSKMTEKERQSLRRRPKDCYDHYDIHGQRKSGKFRVYLGNVQFPIDVYCEMEENGGGWLVIQRRKDSNMDFNLDWMHYMEGFGEVEKSFWLGNEPLHLLTNQRRYTLRVEMKDWRGKERYIVCDNFKVGPKSSKFELISVGSCTGNAYDAMSYHVGSKFSTEDEDNDEWAECSCAKKYNAGWWYKKCSECNLNGQYFKGGKPTEEKTGIEWLPWKGVKYSLKWTQMSVRPFFA